MQLEDRENLVCKFKMASKIASTKMKSPLRGRRSRALSAIASIGIRRIGRRICLISTAFGTTMCWVSTTSVPVPFFRTSPPSTFQGYVTISDSSSASGNPPADATHILATIFENQPSGSCESNLELLKCDIAIT
jgi:hypothetical protein